MTYELFQMGPEVYVPVLLLSLAITAVAYAVAPLVIAITRKKVISIKSYRWLCFGINFAVFFLFGTQTDGVHSGGPYLLWTGIFSSWGLSILRSKCLLEDFKPVKRSAVTDTNCDVVPANSWRCSCGRHNANYVSSCCCGLSKRDAQNDQTKNALSTAVNDSNQFRFCSNCGNKLIINSVFCSKCGTRIVKE